MRYVKVLLLAVVFFLSLVFFFQNQASLSQQLVLTLNLFFIPPMSSIPLPFYFLVVAAFALGALFTLCFLVWDKVNLSARLLKHKWQISSLEREVEKLRKKLGSETARATFLRKADKAAALEAQNRRQGRCSCLCAPGGRSDRRRRGSGPGPRRPVISPRVLTVRSRANTRHALRAVCGHVPHAVVGPRSVSAPFYGLQGRAACSHCLPRPRLLRARLSAPFTL